MRQQSLTVCNDQFTETLIIRQSVTHNSLYTVTVTIYDISSMTPVFKRIDRNQIKSNQIKLLARLVIDHYEFCVNCRYRNKNEQREFSTHAQCLKFCLYSRSFTRNL